MWMWSRHVDQEATYNQIDDLGIDSQKDKSDFYKSKPNAWCWVHQDCLAATALRLSKRTVVFALGQYSQAFIVWIFLLDHHGVLHENLKASTDS